VLPPNVGGGPLWFLFLEGGKAPQKGGAICRTDSLPSMGGA
jgi:hypothetical protein